MHQEKTHSSCGSLLEGLLPLHPQAWACLLSVGISGSVIKSCASLVLPARTACVLISQER